MRPTYHFAPAKNWLSDPNGLVHDGTTWHLFYQYNPHGEDWGHMAWGHAVSSDLVTWHELDPALLENDEHMIFSGSAIIDHANSGGFGHGAMVAIYTSASTGDQPHQAQCLAASTDNGEHWSQFAGNPVLDRGLADFRDPNVVWHPPTGRWVMTIALSTEDAALIYVSDNLRDWRETDRIDRLGAPGSLWECPALIELPIIGTDKTRWLFKVDALNDPAGSGALYQTGQFDGETFVADAAGWQVLDQGADFYAAIPWNGPRDEEGRPCWIGWMGNHQYQGQFPKRGWRGTMSVPRRIGLVQQGDRYRLSQTVEPAALELFAPARQIKAKGCTIPVECRLDLAPEFAGEMHIADGPRRFFSLRRIDDMLHIVRQDLDLPFLNCEREFAMPVTQGLSVFLDSETFELLSADGTIAASFQHRPVKRELTLTFTHKGSVSLACLR